MFRRILIIDIRLLLAIASIIAPTMAVTPTNEDKATPPQSFGAASLEVDVREDGIGSPLSGSTVFIPRTDERSVADRTVVFTRLWPDAYVVGACKARYEQKLLSVTLQDGQTARLEFFLKPLPTTTYTGHVILLNPSTRDCPFEVVPVITERAVRGPATANRAFEVTLTGEGLALPSLQVWFQGATCNGDGCPYTGEMTKNISVAVLKSVKLPAGVYRIRLRYGNTGKWSNQSHTFSVKP